MIPTDKVLLQVALLQCLQAAGDAGRPEAHLLTDARMAGFDSLTLPALQAELRGLADQAWILPVERPLTPKRYRITALGQSKLLEAGV